MLRNTAEHNNDTVARIIAEIDELQNGGAEVGEQVSAKREAIVQKQANIAELQAKLDEINSELLGIINSSDSFSAEIDRLTDGLNRMTMELADRRVTMMTSSTTCDEITARIEAIDALIS